MKQIRDIKTLGALKKAGYVTQSVKDELRSNLILKLKNNEKTFEGILGYEHTVIPSLERAILSRHNINLLGLRGQAKTRIARLLVGLLDEYIPVVAGSEVNDDPFQPISAYALDLITKMKDETPIDWIHRESRYTEKLATPDVSIADLIGDVDPIKAANLKLDYSDQRVIHFGLIPRGNRGIFVINELPDLQPRIQVALFNILQERDLQIRGFKMRFPIDMQFTFTANPEDYTNRGAIITPLKDRIQSQIMTHYPQSVEIAKNVTKQEVNLSVEQRNTVIVPELIENLLEQVAFEARKSEFVDEKSGVSARLSISAYESLVGAAERRRIINDVDQEIARISDFIAVVPAIVGKIEMVYEGEEEGAVNVSLNLLSAAIRTLSTKYFPEIDQIKSSKSNEERNKYHQIIEWFRLSNEIDLINECSADEYRKTLSSIPGLSELVKDKFPNQPKEQLLFMEFLLHALAEFSLLDKKILESSYHFQDLFSSYFPLEKSMDKES